MKLLLNTRELLNLGKTLAGGMIECDEGRCWITQSGDSRDHILKAGGYFQATSGRELIITALEPCCLMLTASTSKKKHVRGSRPKNILPAKVVDAII